MVSMLGVLAWQKRRDPMRLRILLACLLTCGLMMFIAPYGWVYRYDVCLRIFVFLILLGVLSESKRFTPIAALALTLMASVTYLLPLRDSAEFAREIFLQQRQLARFSHDFYHGNVAVNDIGWVSYMSDCQYSRSLRPCITRSHEVRKDDRVDGRHHSPSSHRSGHGLQEWFPQPPASWHLLGQLKLQRRKRFFVGGDTVTFYATGEADLPLLQSRLADFARTLPPGASMTLASDAVPFSQRLPLPGTRDRITLHDLNLSLLAPLSNPRIFLSAGEASGDHYGAQVIAALRTSLPDTTFFGLGGREMADAGFDRIVRAEDVSLTWESPGHPPHASRLRGLSSARRFHPDPSARCRRSHRLPGRKPPARP